MATRAEIVEQLREEIAARRRANEAAAAAAKEQITCGRIVMHDGRPYTCWLPEDHDLINGQPCSPDLSAASAPRTVDTAASAPRTVDTALCARATSDGGPGLPGALRRRESELERQLAEAERYQQVGAWAMGFVAGLVLSAVVGRLRRG